MPCLESQKATNPGWKTDGATGEGEVETATIGLAVHRADEGAPWNCPPSGPKGGDAPG